MKISVVVPLLNERESLPLLAEAIHEVMAEWGKEYEILFVDDGSTDGSFAVCRELREKRPDRIRVYRFGRNYGKAAALRAGIERADGEVIVTMDADLQDDPAAIPAMVAKLEEGYDVVSGWKKKRYDPLSKTLPSKVWNVFTSKVSGIDLHDFNCGFKVYRAAAAKTLDIYGERHRYLPVLAHWDGFRVTEVAVPHHPRKFGRSKYGVSRFVKGILDIVTLIFLRKYLKNPLHFFGLLGILFGLAGSVVLGYFGVQWAITGEMRVRPLVLLSVGAIIMGIQFVSIGLIGEMITHAFPAKYYTIRDALE
jgi:glycosyltransferase involved in cell wall biosynthesis